MFRLGGVFLALIIAVALSGCNPSPSVFAYYDACTLQTTSFIATAECGKRTRNEACAQANSCSVIGNSAVQYADALSDGVRHGEISDAEARQRWIKFKVEQINHMQTIAVQSATAIAASTPRTCFANGFSATCY